jgi:iron complex outermembrane receptor protein
VKCVFADDGVKALEKINGDVNFIPDFIFIDMNMPRMNGKQCLAEIKKIDRLKHIPVYMYSTSADQSTVDENIKLGATEFIIKPSDINTLTTVLSRILQNQMLVIIICLFCFFAMPSKSIAQSDSLPPVKELKKLSVEELMNIVVTSVSKSPEKLSEVASAIQVITSEDINRSTATRLPEALRLASNMQIAQSGAHDWGITARGFKGSPLASTSLANKLLVMIDGRTVYTPLFGGVYWDVQNVMLEDLNRIEVISGPGGTLWGANAMNGIINIISKNAKETQGLYASGSVGTFLKNSAQLRYGSHIDSTIYYRAYAQHFDYNNTTFPGGIDAMDSWNYNQGGFRMDIIPSSKNYFTVQGDLYWGTEDDTGSTLVNGQNLIARWTHTFSESSGLIVQTYFDRTYRNTESTKFTDILTTGDIDIQHSLNLGKRNRVVWGIGFRVAEDNVTSILNNIVPENKTLQLYNAFVQDCKLPFFSDHLKMEFRS